MSRSPRTDAPGRRSSTTRTLIDPPPENGVPTPAADFDQLKAHWICDLGLICHRNVSVSLARLVPPPADYSCGTRPRVAVAWLLARAVPPRTISR
jgi:hypothetical protein